MHSQLLYPGRYDKYQKPLAQYLLLMVTCVYLSSLYSLLTTAIASLLHWFVAIILDATFSLLCIDDWLFTSLVYVV